MRPALLQAKIEQRIARKKGDVFLRDDFSDLGGYDQVGRELRKLVRMGRLIRIGYGLYTRAAASPLDGQPVPTKSLRRLADEALTRLGIRTSETKLERAYNAGRTTQVPAGRVIAVDRRVRRKIGVRGATMSFERA